MPAAVRRAWTRSGERACRTPRMIARQVAGAALGVARARPWRRPRRAPSSSATSGRAASVNGTPVAAATSRATPITDRKSGRFGSTSMSSTASSSPSARLQVVARLELVARGAGCPRASAAIPSSIGEQSMPFGDDAADLARRERLRQDGHARARAGAAARGRPATMLRTPTTTSRSPEPVLHARQAELVRVRVVAHLERPARRRRRRGPPTAVRSLRP